MNTKHYRYILVVLLGIAAAVSAYILAIDTFLWAVNPINNHAYGLTLFMVGDIVLMILLFIRMKLAAFLTAGWGALQIALIAGDISSGMGVQGFTSTDAYNYLILGQGNITGLATDALIALYALISVFSIPAYLRLLREAPKPAEGEPAVQAEAFEAAVLSSPEQVVMEPSTVDTNASKR